MMRITLAIVAALGATQVHAQRSAIREVEYSARRVIDVAVARGVVALIQLPDGEQIRYVASGRASDCGKADDTWCISAPVESNLIFAKAKSRADRFNNVEVVAAQRTYSFRLNLVGPDDPGATQRLVIRAPSRSPSSPMLAPPAASLPLPLAETARGAAPAPASAGAIAQSRATAAAITSALVDEREELAEKLAAGPSIVNSAYSLAVGARSEDIVPTATFDDGRFTYLRVPGNREVPSVFHVTSDGEETIVNTRMERDLLVVDRVSRLLRLRLGNQVVSLINEAFDLEGRPPGRGVTVDGVERVVRSPEAQR